MMAQKVTAERKIFFLNWKCEMDRAMVMKDPSGVFAEIDLFDHTHQPVTFRERHSQFVLLRKQGLRTL